MNSIQSLFKLDPRKLLRVLIQVIFAYSVFGTIWSTYAFFKPLHFPGFKKILLTTFMPPFHDGRELINRKHYVFQLGCPVIGGGQLDWQPITSKIMEKIPGPHEVRFMLYSAAATRVRRYLGKATVLKIYKTALCQQKYLDVALTCDSQTTIRGLKTLKRDFTYETFRIDCENTNN